MFFTVDLFVDALILLLHSNDSDVRDFVNQILVIYEKESKSSVDETSYFDFYINLIREVMNRNITVNDVGEVESLLLKIKSNPLVIKDPELYSNLKRICSDRGELSQDQHKFYLRKIANATLWYNDTTAVKKMFAKLANNAALKDPDQQDTVLEELNTLCSSIIQQNQDVNNRLDEKSDETRITYLDSSDRDSIAKALKVYNTTSVVNTFKTGLQGLNRALGGGFKLGSSIVFNSCSHNGKSLSLLKMARWQVTLNKPSEQFRNPTCLIYSLENETPQNLLQLFNELYVNKFKKVPPANIPEEDIVTFCYEEFHKLGWKLIIDRRLGANFGFPELVADFEEYLSLGFTPLMCVIDYMNMMRKGRDLADGGGANALMVRDLYTNVCNYLKAHNCTLVTAHQLNRKAVEVARLNPLGAVKRFGPDMLADSTDVQREVDIAIYQHKESDTKGNAFMTYNVSKVRYNNDIPERDRYFAYAFHGPLGILDDVDGVDMSTDNIYAYDYAREDAKLYPDGRPETESDRAYKAKHPDRAMGEEALRNNSGDVSIS